jgi:hypothetical protein
MRLNLKSIMVMGGFALSLAAAQAIDLFNAIPLPDDGYGSRANATIDYGDGAAAELATILGQKTDMFGRTLPMAWDLDNDGNYLGATQLPLPPGFQGGCCNGTLLDDGDVVIVGNLTDTNGRTHAVVWRKPLLGGWSMPQPLAPGSPQSHIGSGDDPNAGCGDSLTESGIGYRALVCAFSVMDELGRWRAAVAEIDSEEVDSVLLPSPPGRDSAALGISCDSSGNMAACGWVESAVGLPKPAGWYYDFAYAVWEPLPIDVPNNASGAANQIIFDDGTGPHILGELNRSGRMLGFYTGVNEGGLLGLQPLEGFLNSAANEFLSLGDTGTHEVGHWMGLSSNPGELGEATVWIDLRPVSAQRLLVDQTEVSGVSYWGWDLNNDGLFAPAQIMGNPPLTPPQAGAMRVTDNNVPSRTDLITGRVYNGPIGQQLWHLNDHGLHIQTARSGGDRVAEVELTFSTVRRGIVSYEWDLDYDGIAWTEGNQATGGTINVYLYCHTHQQFESGGSFPVSDTPAEMSAQFIEGAHSYHDPATGTVRSRLKFVQNGNQPTGLVLDLARLKIVPRQP